MFFELFLIVAGFFLLVKSSDMIVDSLVYFSRRFGVSEFVVSFLIVGIVATFPELSIGVNSAVTGNGLLGLGIILGSNVVDITLIIGFIALFVGGIFVERDVRERMKWFFIPLSLPLILIFDGELSRIDGLILIHSFVVYAIWMFAYGKKTIKVNQKVDFNGYFRDGVKLVLGLVVLILSGDLITASARIVSAELGLPLVFVGMMLAIGTCLPELTLAIRASRAKHGELGIGNVYGNVLSDATLSLGIIAVIHPINVSIPQIPIAGALASVLGLLLTLFFIRKGNLTKRNGLILIACYFAFIVIQILLEARYVK